MRIQVSRTQKVKLDHQKTLCKSGMKESIQWNFSQNKRKPNRDEGYYVRRSWFDILWRIKTIKILRFLNLKKFKISQNLNEILRILALNLFEVMNWMTWQALNALMIEITEKKPQKFWGTKFRVSGTQKPNFEHDNFGEISARTQGKRTEMKDIMQDALDMMLNDP
jgi:hypothetical protein